MWQRRGSLRGYSTTTEASTLPPHQCNGGCRRPHPLHGEQGGNDKADALAEFGREMHPNNKKRKGDSDRVPRLWRDAGLSPMRTNVSSSESSGDDSSVVSSWASARGELHPHADVPKTPSSSGGSSGEGSSDSEGSGFSTEVSERQRERKRQRRAGGERQDRTTVEKPVR